MPETPYQRHALAARRDRLVSSLSGRGFPVVLPAGWARPRNFAHNVYPFRAESHFLYFVGAHIEGALLVWQEGVWVLYMESADPDAELWSGRAKTSEEWSEELGLPVRPLADLQLSEIPACLPPQEEETAAWLESLLKRSVEAQSGPELQAEDALLAEAVVRCRLSADEAAITGLAAAASGSAEAHRVGMRATRGAKSEAEVRGAMVGALVAAGLEPGYTPIVTTHGEILHAERSDGFLNVGDLLLCDVGGETRSGWNGDITRTWPVSGKFSPSQREIYDAVLSVQLNAIDHVCPGVDYADLHVSALRDLAAALRDLGLLKGSTDALLETGAVSVFFPHGLGHLLGIDVHDMEDLGDRAGYGPGATRSEHPTLSNLRLRRTLSSGMCVTIEPGFYQVPFLLERARADATLRTHIDFVRLEDFSDVRGIRIEDDVLVEESGCRVLSHAAPKGPREIEEWMDD